jgi:glyoxylase-like metal-dependent hydrolase (beta-lactamase superfamily II)
MSVHTSVFIVTTEQGVALLDCGTTITDVKGYIIPALKEMYLVPDIIVASHNHGDHMGGMPYLAKAFPNAKLAMISEKHAARYPEKRRQILRDGDLLLGCLRVMHFPAHSTDALAILDERTRTLLTFDCLQVQGIGQFGTSIADIAEYKKTIERIKNENIEFLVASHEYYPIGSTAKGKEEIARYLAACREEIDGIFAFVTAHKALDGKALAALFKETYPDHPTVPHHTFSAAKDYLS